MRKLWLSLLIGMVATLLYWAAFAILAYPFLAGDRRDGAAAGEGAAVFVWGAALTVYLVGFWLLLRRREAGRALTDGELAAARSVFDDAIAWERVRVHARGFTPFQPRRTAVSPLGAIHFRREDCLPDFSGDWADMAWLIHELVHVWQYQTGVPVILRGLWERRYAYGALDPARPLRRYGIEQQAAIVEDWFRRGRGQPPWRGSGSEADYRAVIPFLPGSAGAKP